MTLDINIVVERGREEVHRDITIKCSLDIFNLTCLLVKLCHFKHIMLLSAMLRKDKVIILVHVEIHEVVAPDFSILDHLFLRNDLDARVLIFQCLLILSEENCSISEVVQLFVAIPSLGIKLDGALQLSSIGVPCLNL